MLGAMKKCSVSVPVVCSLNPGDMLIAYSDGVTECRNTEDHEFETDRLGDCGELCPWRKRK